MKKLHRLIVLGLVFVSLPSVRAQAPFDVVAKEVNRKMVKVFGSGGYKGLVSYGTGIVVSPKGHVLTANSQLLDTQDLRLHLFDGRRVRAKVIAIEPEFDAAVLEIKQESSDTQRFDLPYFDVPLSAKQLTAGPGDWVLAFTNSFQIATRDEAMSIQRGVISAHTKLVARRGITEIPFGGDVFFVDAITNNPGSAGGALTTRKGQLIGMIGKEYRNVQSDTWTNFSIPLNCKVEIKQGEKTRTATLADFVSEAMAGKWVASVREKKLNDGPGAYHGIVFVPNILEKTPPFVEKVEPGSPAAKAGLRPDDLIVYIEGDPVYSIKAFRDMMARGKPGMELKFEVRRGEKLTSVNITLGDLPKR
jgi:S1-C subfamily serine protease